MTHKGYRFQVEAKVEFTPDEVKHLIALSGTHYDDKCRVAGRPGGFLYRISVRMGAGDAAGVPCVLSSDQVDTLVKIVESDEARSDRDKAQLFRLWYPLQHLLQEMGVQWMTLNSAPQTGPYIE